MAPLSHKKDREISKSGFVLKDQYFRTFRGVRNVLHKLVRGRQMQMTGTSVSFLPC